MTLSPQEFVAKWRGAALKESAAYQEHFTDLCRLLVHPTPAEVDPAGKWFTFQAGADKVSGGQGFADVWKMGYFAWEYKGPGADLGKAYQQLLQYREALLNPPLLIVSDFQRIIVHTNFTNTVKRVVELRLDDLLVAEKLAILRQAFENPEALRSPQTASQVTEEAARQFARLAQLLRKYGADPHAAARFLIRLLFCLFAEDVGILPDGLFTKLVTRPHKTAKTLTDQLRQLFAAMATGGVFGADEIKHVDGGLFDDDAALDLGSDGLALLAEVSSLDWSAIQPSIFGTLFERGLDPAKRSQLGAHYTSEEDILLIVEPVLMAPLRRRWAEVKVAVKVKAEKRDLVGAGLAPAQGDRKGSPLQRRTNERAKLDREIFALLRGFREELAAVRVLDAACGSGNFLYVALRLLLDLEKEALNLALSLGDSLAFPLVSPRQLHGIEINPYAYALAQTTIWIGYIQWLRENGFGLPGEPILKPLDAIQQMDAILAGSGDQAAGVREPEWPAADVIIGNPPFLGGNKIRKELGDAYVDALFKLYEGRVPAFADLVCYWFEKARAQIAAGKAKRAGLLATQAIRGGANRKVLERIKETGDIFWAQADRNWILDGAMVHVSMVGFDNGTQTNRELDGQLAIQINADLTTAVDVTKAVGLIENKGISFIGASPKAPFDIKSELATSFLSAPVNINGRPNADVVRPVVSGIDLVQTPRELWTIDFGTMPLDQASAYEAPFEYVRRHILPLRAERRADFRGQWWQYARPRPEMRVALAGNERFIATARIAKHRVFVWLASDVLANDQTVVFARDDDYFLGVLHSRVHELWARATGTQLREAESGFRYTPTTTFETFPCPWPPGHEPADDPRVAAIAAAARELVAKRDAWLSVGSPANVPGTSGDSWRKADRGEVPGTWRPRTLTGLYNARPAWLDLAHRKLDAAVLDAYGWPHDVSDEEILARLLALNHERARAGLG
jgi:type II restriction/modification system DNA methylase subunit YeeA